MLSKLKEERNGYWLSDEALAFGGSSFAHSGNPYKGRTTWPSKVVEIILVIGENKIWWIEKDNWKFLTKAGQPDLPRCLKLFDLLTSKICDNLIEDDWKFVKQAGQPDLPRWLKIFDDWKWTLAFWVKIRGLKIIESFSKRQANLICQGVWEYLILWLATFVITWLKLIESLSNR